MPETRLARAGVPVDGDTQPARTQLCNPGGDDFDHSCPLGGCRCWHGLTPCRHRFVRLHALSLRSGRRRLRSACQLSAVAASSEAVATNADAFLPAHTTVPAGSVAE